MAKKKSSFRGKVHSDAQRQESSKFGYLNVSKDQQFSPEVDTKVMLDFMPYEVTDIHHSDRNEKDEVALVGDLWYKRSFKVHRNVGSSNDAVVCLTSFGKKCPICEYRAKRVKEGADKDELDALKTSDRNLYVVIPLDSKKHKVQPYVMDISQAMFGKLLKKELDDNPDCEVFPDLEEGMTLKVRFDGKTMGTSKPFPEATRIDFYDRKKPYPESILEEIPNLDKVLRQLTYAELEAKFFEIDNEDAAEDLKESKGKKEEEEAPRKRKTVKEEEEEPPVRKRKTVEPEPEEAPRKRRAVKEEPEPEPEPEEVEITWEDLQAMKPSVLKQLCEENGLETNPNDFDDDPSAFRRAIAKEIGIEYPKKALARPSTKEEEEDEEPAPKMTSRSKPVKEEEPTGTCPFKHKFGVDGNKFDDCDDCKVWDDCLDAKEKKTK